MIRSMTRIRPGNESLAFALLAIGTLVVLAVSGPAAVLGIPLMALGWCLWLTTAAFVEAPSRSQESIPWVACSSAFMMAGTMGLQTGIAPALPSLVLLLVGASVWCLTPMHRGLVAESDERIASLSLIIVSGLCRWAALKLVLRSAHAGLSTEGTLVDAGERVIECLIVASSAACTCCLARLWQSRKSLSPIDWLVGVVQLQTSIALAAIAVWAWSLSPESAGRIDVLVSGLDELPAALIAWDSLTTALCCASLFWGAGGRSFYWAATVGFITILDLASLPPMPGFWLRWQVLKSCVYPYHLEPLAGMFDLHEGFRLLACILVVGQVCVTIRLLSWLTARESSSPRSQPPLDLAQRGMLDAATASISHE